MKKAIFDDFADIYDEDMAKQKHLKGDIEMYLQYVKKVGSPILDICCGTGRVAIPLLKKGFDVIGVDISKEMIDKFTEKIVSCKEFSDEIYCCNALLWDDPKDRKYKLIIMADDSLLHFTSFEEQLAILKKCYGWLDRRGILIIDIFRQHYEDLVYYKTGGRIIGSVKRYKTISPDFDTQINTITYHYPNGKKRINEIKFISYSEALLMFKLCGFKVMDSFGNYNKSSCTYKQPKMIFILKKDNNV